MAHMLDLKTLVGPSSGTTTVGDEIRDAREFNVGTDGLRDTREVVEVRVDGRPGMMEYLNRISNDIDE